MRLFHSSEVLVEKPDTNHSRDFLDFGKGFYMTSIQEQAERYAQRLFEGGGVPGSTRMSSNMIPRVGIFLNSIDMTKIGLTSLQIVVPEKIILILILLLAVLRMIR